MKKEINWTGRIRRVVSVLLLIVFTASSMSWAAGFDSQEIKFDKILNARDLGGYTTKYNRKPSKKAPKKRYRRFKNKSKKSLRKKAISSFGKVGRSYTNSLVNSSYSQRQYRKYFNELLANNSGNGILLHCTWGKDRTGVASFMTLIALGVDEETAYRDYAMTNSYLKKYGKKTYRKGRIGVREKDLRYAVNKAKKKYGSLDNFLKKAYGLDAAKIAKLRAIYTE